MKNNLFLRKIALYGIVGLIVMVLLVIMSFDLTAKIAGQKSVSIFKKEFVSNASQKFQKEKWQLNIIKEQFSQVKSLINLFQEHLSDQSTSTTSSTKKAEITTTSTSSGVLK